MLLSIYIHVPFCKKKCAYCDFYSLAGMDDQMERYTETLCKELHIMAVRYDHPEVRTIFFGGGTPTLLSYIHIRRIMSFIRDSYDVLPDCEITMEGNPGTLTEENLAGYRDAGVNRLSIGVQSFSDRLLRMIGRIHTADEAVNAVRLARRAGFDNLNLDLMYGLPGSNINTWQETIDKAVRLSPEHLSCYSLIIEPGTPLAAWMEAGKGEPVPDEDTLIEMETLLRCRLAEAGYERYEVSNYAKPGRQCRHNLVYWECMPYLGCGPAAHSDCGGRRFYHPDSLSAWIEALADKFDIDRITVSEGTGDKAERRYERMMMGFRMTRGVDLVRFRSDFGAMPEAFWPDTLAEMERLHMIDRTPQRMHLTDAGMDVMNYWLVRMMEEQSISE